MRYKVIFCVFCTILVVLSGCNIPSLKSIDEGEIHYRIIFHDRNAVLPDELMPSSMVVKFKKDKMIMEITSPVGNNGVFIISDPETKEIKTFIRILGMKYYYVGTFDEIAPGLNPMANMVIRKTNQVSSILDMECRRAIASIPEKDFTYDLWYTKDIDIKNPNIYNPFRDIDGVLINFFFMMGDVTIEFQAEGVYMRTVPDKTFQKGENFRRIDRKSMNDLIASMMSL